MGVPESMIGPGHKTPCRQQRRAIGGKWQQAGSPGHGNQPATALLRGVPRKDTGIARIQGLPEKSPPWAHGDECSHPCLRRPYRCPFGRAGTNESTTPPGRQRNPENRTIQKTGQQKSPTLLAAYQQGQAFGVWAWGLARRLSGRTPETVAERGGFEPPKGY